MLSPSSFVWVHQCWVWERSIWQKRFALDCASFLAGTGLFLTERVQSQPLLHITPCAPGLLAFSSLPACTSFVVFWLIGHCFNYYCTKETCIFYLSFCCLSDHGLQAANTELELFRSGVNWSGSLGVSLLYISLGGNTPPGRRRLCFNSSFFALSRTPWSALTGTSGKEALASILFHSLDTDCGHVLWPHLSLVWAFVLPSLLPFPLQLLH